MRKIASLFVALLLLAGCSSVPLTGRKQVLLVSDQEVLSSSLTQYNDYIKTAKKSTNANKSAMVTRVGKKIAAATEDYLRANGMADEVKNFSWEFNLVNDPQVNAFCMPGGKIVVYEGLLPLVSSDDELAVVIGHEVAHAVAKHSNERMSQQLMHLSSFHTKTFHFHPLFPSQKRKRQYYLLLWRNAPFYILLLSNYMPKKHSL